MYNDGMDRKSKILLYTFFFLFAGTVMFSFARYMIFRDFEVIIGEPMEDTEPDDESMTEMGTVGADGKMESVESSVE
jgi:hypothetical protein